MRVPKIVASLMVGAGLLGGLVDAEAKGTGTGSSPLQTYIGQMARQGWVQIQPGVLQRTTDSGKTERFAYGEEGLYFALQEAKRQLGTFIRLYKANPTKDGAQAVEAQADEVKRLEIELAQIGPNATRDLEAFLSNGCSFSFSYNADAYHLTTSQGVGAAANASFTNSCGYVGNVYAQAFVAGTAANTYTTSLQRDPVSGTTNGTNVSATASRTLAATSSCYSSAEAAVTISGLGLNLSATDTNGLCPVPPNPPSVYISGSTYEFRTGYNCNWVTWSAVASNGTPGYSYSWTFNGSYAGSGSTMSQSLCGSGLWGTDYYTVGVTVTDSTSQTASDLIGVAVETYQDNCNPYQWPYYECNLQPLR